MKRIVITATAALLTTAAFAGDLLQWQDNSLSFLAGGNYELDPDTQQTVTLEHASGWSMGDLFVFVDGIHFDGERDIKGNQITYYGEVAPRLSAGKILNKDLSVPFIKDFLVAGCWEFGENVNDNHLIGPGLDLDIPGFDYVQLNVYRRFDDGSPERESYQITPVWKFTVPLGQSAFICDGFIDWVIAEGTDNLHICPQFKFDIGVLLGMEERALLAGIEYDYWKNKYDLEDGTFGLDSNQSTFSALVKYHF